MGDISLDMIKDFYSLKTVQKPREMTSVKITGRHLAQARADVYKPEFKLCKQKPTMRSPPTSPVGDYCSTGPRLEDLYDEMAQLELDLPGGTTNDLETASMKEEEDAHILENYSFDHIFAPELPITSYHQQIVDTIESNSVTVIQGATGSGKTTQVPQYILDEYTKNGRYCNIIVTQPRRIAAISIAKRVCQERGWTLGSLVGYQVARDKCVSEDTRLTYVTTGVLLQKLIQSKNMNQYTHVFLDEVHERDQDTDFSLLVVKKLLRTNSRHVKIVLMSATIESDLFSMYFAVPVRGRVEGAPVVSVEGKSFPVVECYLDQLSDLMEFVYDGMPMPYNTLEEPGITPEGYQLAALLIKHLDQLEKTSNPKPGMPATRGTVLVFLPGIFEIKHMDQMLEDMCEDAMLVILPLHSQITNQEQSDVFRQAPEGYRKVILSTNIAESSITVPDIKYVIDFCLVKCLICDPETNFQSLRIQWSSKASSTQRKGRAGRVSSGTCFRMVTREFYESILPEFGIPEMKRCPLEQIVLQVKLLDIGPPKGILKLALQPPDIDDIEKTVLLLKQVGALSIRMRNGTINPHDGELTFVGKVLGSLPIDVHLGKLLVLAYVFGCLEECLVISASLSLRSFFNRPFKQELKAFSKKMGWADYSFSDCIAVLKAYKEWSMLKRRKGFPRGEVNWCNENFIQAGRIREVEELMKELTERLKQLNLLTIKPLHQKDSNSPKNLRILKLVICGAFYPNYFVSSEIDESDVLKTMSGHDPHSTVMVRNMPPHGATYRSAIARLFRPCGKGKALYFEETRGYIEFEKPVKVEQNSGSNFILPAVYMAIKMRHLRMPLNLFISEAKNARMEKLMQKKMEEQRMNSNRLLTSRVATSLKVKGKGSFEFDGGPQQVDLPQKGYIEIFTTEVIDAGHFWAQKPDSESATKLQHLQETINLFGGRNLEPLSDTELSSGMFCLAFFNEDELFYRARIIGIERKRIQVLYLDFGNTAWLPFIQVRKIKAEFLNLPFQAFECVLCEVFPAPSPYCPAGTWPPLATQRFVELTQNRKLVAKVYSLVRNVLRVDLYDTNTDEDIHVNQLLIDEGYAHFKEEPRASKMARQRAESATGDNSQPDENVNWLDDAVFEEEQNMQDELVTKVSLRGPESPLEMNFHCVTNIGQLRSTRIEQDSVNSVVLKDDLQDPHQRFMVAANIGINSSGRTVVARDTTLMPNIHGLFPLVSLIFAPFAELRTDPEKRQYTGALVGLGYDPRTNKPLLPDHDIELTFEADITRDDIVGVNSIRTAINLAYHSEESIAGWGTPAVERIQNAAREMILELIFRKRENRKPCPFARPCRWNQIDPSYILQATSTEEGTAEQYGNELYTMHNGIAISGKPLDEDEAAAKVEEMRQKVEWLKSLAGRVSEPFTEEVVCPICNVICRHPRAVSIHLRSPYHREEETRLYED